MNKDQTSETVKELALSAVSFEFKNSNFSMYSLVTQQQIKEISENKVNGGTITVNLISRKPRSFEIKDCISLDSFSVLHYPSFQCSFKNLSEESKIIIEDFISLMKTEKTASSILTVKRISSNDLEVTLTIDVNN